MATIVKAEVLNYKANKWHEKEIWVEHQLAHNKVVLLTDGCRIDLTLKQTMKLIAALSKEAAKFDKE